MSKQYIVTNEGLEKLLRELEDLKTVKRKEVTDKIKTALSFGDLSENSEYDEAKNEQAMLESRISQIELMLKNIKVLDESEISTDSVYIGCKVTVLDTEYDEEMTYQIVGSTEADPMTMKISDESPVGKALLGHKIGDTITVDAPESSFQYKILDIGK